MLPFNIFLMCSIFGYGCNKNSNDEVDYYEKLINDSLREADEFELPKNARMYEAENSEIKDFGSFDFVIVGAGSTGCVIANRLSENKDFNILLLEAGNFIDNFTQIPYYGFPALFSDYNWAYESIPQTTACLGMASKRCPYPRGKGVGGTSLVNGLVYARGHPKDFDLWAAQGNPGWRFNDLLPYFKKSEDFHKTNPMAPVNYFYHGSGGNLRVEYNMPPKSQVEVFLKAAQELGYNLSDYNSPNQIGVSPSQLNTNKGRRADTGSAFIKPILDRNNLKIMTNSYVIKLEIDPVTKTAVKVHFTKDGTKFAVNASKEIIVCAGAIGTPQLLMLSGIGPKSHLEALQIPVLNNLEVGSTLRDHSQYFGLVFSSNATLVEKPLREAIKDYLKGFGELALPGPNDAVGFFRSSLEMDLNYPDLELMMISQNSNMSEYFKRVFGWEKSIYDSIWNTSTVTNSFQLYVINLHQKSIGNVRLSSNSPYDYPLIDANFLSDTENHDINLLYEGIQFALKLTETKSFREIDAKLIVKPLPQCKSFEPWSKDYWYCTIKYLTANVYHPMGSCPMGPDPQKGAVVDHNLKVYGVNKLRVADASIFPITTSGHPNAPCIMIGEKLSDLVKSEYIQFKRN